MRDFRTIKAWEKGHALTLAVYQATSQFPREDQFGLTSQMRRAAASVPANIAEGCGRDGKAELVRFCQIGFASTSELEYWLILARDLSHLDESTFATLTAQTVEVKKMLGAFLTTLRGRGPRTAD